MTVSDEIIGTKVQAGMTATTQVQVTLKRVRAVGFITIGRSLALAGLAFSAVFGAICTHAQTQPYPTHPIKLIVGFPPGGGSDTVARLLGAALSVKLGQQIVLDNKAGANTIIATQFVRSQPPDGYTLLFVSASFAINPAMQKLDYDIYRDFTPVALVVTQPLLLVTPNEVPAKSVRELISLAKAQPGKLTYATFGIGSAAHLASELLLSMTGTDMIHVPYKGSPPALVDVMGGRVTMMMPSIGSALNFANEGKLRALAVSSSKRVSGAPGIPTIAESGVPGFDLVTWESIQAPAGTPPEIVARLNSAIREVVATPELREKLIKLGAEPEATKTPGEVAKFIRSEAEKFGKIIRERNIKAE